MNRVTVYEFRVKAYLLKDIVWSDVLASEAEFLDSVLAKEPVWMEYHEENRYKLYCMSGFYPLEKDGRYKAGNVYTITMRTVVQELAKYFSSTLNHHETERIKGLTVENRIIPRKVIGEIYSLTPVIQKCSGYWKNEGTVVDFERRLFESAVKKYNQFTGQKIDEDFQLYTNITFLNKKPISNKYKGIHLLGDKINLKIADNAQAQELAYFLLGSGLCEMSGRGYGYCNYRWI